jgi:hypothetical protein
VEVLVPELVLHLPARGADAEARERRRQRERRDPVRRSPRDGLGDPAAHVVAVQQHAVEPELLDEAEHARGLGVRAVGGRGLRVVAVGSAEAPQVGHDDVELAVQQCEGAVLVPPAARPAVQ